MLCKALENPVILAALFLCPSLFAHQAEAPAGNVSVPLQVKAGTPLRLYLTKRVWYRKGEIVQAKFAEPVWAFDRIVIPAGSAVQGELTDLEPVPKMVRAMSIVRGDFTPFKRARLRFTTIGFSSGQRLAIATDRSIGLGTIYVPPRPPHPLSAKQAKAQEAKAKKAQAKIAKRTEVQAKKAAKSKSKTSTAEDQGSRSAWLRSFLKQQARIQANARTGGLFDFVRLPNKREWIQNFFLSALPYRPQWYRSGTRFDAVLEKPLDFGTVSIPGAELRNIAATAPPDATAMLRFSSTSSSADAKVGDPIAGVLTQPVFSADHRMLLPEGTRLTGRITLAHSARMFHRGGQLRFTFNSLEVPTIAAITAPAVRLEAEQAQLIAAEPATGALKVDQEGTAKATESKARFLRPIVAGLIAAKSMDNDTGKQTASGGADANYSGRALGGFSGFGFFGTLVARGPRVIGSALGFYGLAWSVYGTVVSRGRDVIFEKNTAMAIRFGDAGKGR